MFLNLILIMLITFNTKFNSFKVISTHRDSIKLFSTKTPLSFQGYSISEAKADAYSIAKSSNISLPIIILVNPFLDSNVGSVSRAMLNFGCYELRVVDPICNITSENALALSAGSNEVLQNAKIYPTLSDAIGDLNRVFATTVRLRHMNQMIYTPRAAAEVIVNYKATPTPTISSTIASTDYSTSDNNVDTTIDMHTLRSGIVFGRERNGLNNDEVALCDSIISIPTFKHFSSLNLAQAVNIVAYEVCHSATCTIILPPYCTIDTCVLVLACISILTPFQSVLCVCV